MLIGLPVLKTIYLLLASSLFAQLVLSSGKDDEVLLWIDFDGTIATNEAFETLALAAYDSMTAQEAAQFPPWSYYGDVYYAEYLDFADNYGPRENISAEIAYRSSPALHKVESDSFERVSESGIFDYMQFPVLQKAAATVTIREGFWKMIASSLECDITPRIASLNWSVRWIRQVLREDLKRMRANATAEERGWLKADLAEDIAIYCSEILPDGMVRANKLDFPTRLHTGMDKVELMARFEADRKGKKEADRVLFFGDSTNDLPPLWLEPTTVGVVAGLDSGMNKTLTKFGIELVKLDPEVKVQDTVGEGFLYQTDEYFAVGSWLTGESCKKRKGY
ncbi:uncharacterized protein H6S33_000844 [Morchella sextelata]|uniref:uncharacterized protein n=1 Tax=Morchella sextelata TaxID=1174677 RepID=UPI001D055F96|nr:uncharacterized protein H6S33_000844 [Morchella sextelata]KAH0615208.1 hypothetical protein H6S33_000844 [Morchella sextelata]